MGIIDLEFLAILTQNSKKFGLSLYLLMMDLS